MRAYHWRIGTGLVALVTAAAGWLLWSESGLATLLGAVARLRGGTIEYRELHGRLLDGGTITELRYRDARIELNVASLAAHWRWRPFELHVTEVVIDTPILTTWPSGDEPRLARLPIPIRIDRLRIDQMRLQSAGSVRPMPESVEAALQFTAAGIAIPAIELTFRPPVVSEAFGDVRISGEATIATGAPLVFRVTARATASATPRGEFTANIDGEGRWPRFDVRRLELRGAGGESTFTGAIDLSPVLDVDLAATWRDLPVAPDGRWPTSGSAMLRGPWQVLRAQGNALVAGTPTGEVAINYAIERRDQGFIVHSATGQVATGGSFELHAAYAPRAATPQLAIDLDWHDLALVPGAATAVTSAEGSLRIEGMPDAYRLWLRGALDGERIAPMTIAAEGVGDAAGLALDQVELVTLGGRIQGTLRVAAGATPTIDFTLAGTDLDPGQRWPALPGVLAVDASGQVSRDGDGMRLAINSLDATGQLRGHPLLGRLREFTYGVAGWAAAEFRLESGRTRLQGSGRFDTEVAVDLRLRSPDLGELVPDAAGDLAFDAALTGAPGEQQLRITANGHGLRLAETRAANLVIDAALDLRADGPVAATVRFDHVRLLGQRIVRLHLDLDGTGAAHVARLSATGIGQELQARLSGALGDSGWIGTLNELRFDDEVLGVWTLANEISLTATRTEQRFETLCLQGDPGELCGWARRRDGDWQAGIRGERLPLARIPIPDRYGIEVVGQIGFDLDVAGTNAGIERGSLAAMLEQAEISSAVVNPIAQRIPLDGGNLTVSYAGGTLVAEAGVHAAAIASRPLALTVHVEGLGDTKPQRDNARIEGKLSFDLTELSPLSVLLPQIARPEGRIAVDLALTGTLGDPQFDGWAELREAAFDLPRFGTRIEDLHLTLTGDPTRQLRLAGGLRSGGGHTDLAGEVALLGEHAPAINMTVTGALFELIATQAAHVSASPELRVVADRRGASVTGLLHVPNAQLQPMLMREASSISEDVVIVDGDLPIVHVASPWPVAADIVVEFGDAVRAAGPMFDTKLGGLLRVRGARGREYTASGRITLVGDVLAYGARLAISNGRIIFAGGPLADPVLDLRAQREIDTLTVGLKVSGTAGAPEISLYSAPALSQDRILSYLVLGKPLNELSNNEGSTLLGTAASLGLRNADVLTGRISRAFGLDQLSLESGATFGDTALVIGKYLTPKLYLSYGIGLFEPVGTTRLRYEVNRHWSIQAEQGKEMGVDVFYRIER